MIEPGIVYTAILLAAALFTLMYGAILAVVRMLCHHEWHDNFSYPAHRYVCRRCGKVRYPL